jgi:hypothetical protein
VSTIIKVPPKKQARKSRRKRAPGVASFGNVVPFPKRTVPSSLDDPEQMAVVFELPPIVYDEPSPSDGALCGVEGCDCRYPPFFCEFLLAPCDEPRTVMVTRHPRLARAFPVVHPGIYCFSFDDESTFVRAQCALHRMCVHCERLDVEPPGSTVEECLAAFDKMAGLTLGDGAPQ